jgi:hypothetical protein
VPALLRSAVWSGLCRRTETTDKSGSVAMQLAKPNGFLPGTGQAMEYFLIVAGLIWIFCGALVLGLSASATPELIACLAFSFGVMFLGLSALIGQLRTLSATSRSAHFSGLPPPVPLEYAISIEEAINSARAAARLTGRLAWIQSFDANRSTVIVNNAGSVTHHHMYPAPAQYFAEMLPASLPAPTELVEIGGEYYVGPPRTSDEATALSRLQEIFSD